MGSRWNDKAGGIETFYHDGSTEGKKLANAIHKQLLKGTNLKDRGVKKDTTIYKSGFHELRETIMPAVLLECGFMSNHVEANLMKNINYQHECAIEVLKGICDYFGIGYNEEKEKLSKLEEYTRIISPKYYKVWMKHFKASSGLPWEEFLKNALRKKLP
jgi:N-acetylmuramoyl-L-alanine amidase